MPSQGRSEIVRQYRLCTRDERRPQLGHWDEERVALSQNPNNLQNNRARFGAGTARKHGRRASGPHPGPSQTAQDGAGLGCLASF
jgi:hypothetical protein